MSFLFGYIIKEREVSLMIYDFIATIKNSKGKKIDKQFYLTADNIKQLYRLIWEMYRLKPEEIKIRSEINDENIDINTNKREIKRAEGVFTRTGELDALLSEKIYGRPLDFFEDKKSNKFEIVEIKFDETSIKELLNKYKKVKIYYLRTGAKKNKQYIAVCK